MSNQIPCNVGSPWTLALPSGAGTRTLNTLRIRLAEIDGEVADLQTRLGRLAAERKPIEEALKSVIYPVLTLPPEITAEIFMHCVDSAHIGGSDPDVPNAPGETGGCGPLLLAGICHAWRDIALALRPIWSNFQLFTTPNTISSTEKLLQCWLPRTGGHPLDISLHRAPDILCTALAPYLHQFRVFSCTVDTPITFPSDSLRGRIPLLRKLDISLSAYPEDLVGPPTPLTAFTDAPQLREVILTAFPFNWIALPWGQLTRLDLMGQDTAQCVEILHHTPNLEMLYIDLIDSPDMPPAPVQLAHLHTLKFSAYLYYFDILDHLILPALRHIEISMVDYEAVPRFSAFIARSACALRSITLNSTSSNSVVECLRAVPTVSVVRLMDVEWYIPSFTHFFDVLAGEADFLPNVRSLSLNPCVHAIEIPYADLAALLASRWLGRSPGDARLESFELILAPVASTAPTPTVAQLQLGLDALQALKADGLKINIRSLQKMTTSVDAVAVYPVLM
ncbi:hypothetical protein B0H13DRAFT_2566028 [Mycena leptocephala]|nr:hypothetical protein B0H13DRAFT_2566028 [Mycena leptocephala]